MRTSVAGMILIFAALSSVLFVSARIVNNIQFDQNCEGYLKRAADANTVELARTELSTAVGYIEQNGLTGGYTSILYRTPDEDVGFWYTNTKRALEELQALPATATPLERSNMLMKLRETLLDNGEHGMSVTVPPGISIYPDNVGFAWWGWLSFLGLVAGAFAFVASESYY